MNVLKKRFKTLIALFLIATLVLTNNSALLQAAIPDNYYNALNIGDKVRQNATLNYAYVEWYMIDNYSNYVFEFTDDVGTTTVNGPIIYPSLTKADVNDTQCAYITKLDNSTINIYDLWAYEYGGKTYYYKQTEYNKGFSECILFHSSDSLSLTRDRGSAKEYTETSEFDISSVPSDVPKTVIGAGGHPYETCYVRVSTPAIRTIGINEWTVTGIQYNNNTATISLSAKTPHVVGIDANYGGNSILVGNEFDENQVEIYVDYDDGSYEAISYSQLETKPTSKIVNKVDWDNQYEVGYEGLTDTFEVHGYDYTKIQAQYNGSSIEVGNNYNVEDVVVTASYTYNLQGIESRVLNTDEWEPSSTTITKINSNEFTATLKDKRTLTSNYVVPGADAVKSITAVYKGPDVYVGNTYNKEDVEVTATYYSGSSRVLGSSEWTASSLTVNVDGENEFTATCGNVSTTYKVKGYAEGSIGAEYHGDSIPVGEEYDKDDVYVFVYYTNGTAKLLSSDEWQEDSLVVTKGGDNPFTAAYKTFTDTFNVPGEKELVGLEAVYIGEDVPKGLNYDKEEVKVVAIYNDGSREDIDVADWMESSLKVTKEGTNEYVAIYEGFTVTYTVTGTKSITELKAVYTGDDVLIGTTYDKSKVKVTAIYNDGSEVILGEDDWQESSLSVTKVGTNTFTATYEGLSAEYTVNGLNQLESIKAVYTGPVVEVGQSYNKDDVTVTAVYRDETEVVVPKEEWTESSLVVNKAGENDYTATYKTLQTTYSVTGISKEAVLESLTATYKGIDISTGKEYNKADVEVTATYSDGVKRVLATDEWTASSLVVVNEGKNEFTATHQGLTANYTVNGVKIITGIEAVYTGSDIATGKNYDKKDVVVKSIYHDGSKQTLAVDDWKESALLVSKEGKNEYTATYNEFTATYFVTGVKIISGIEATYTGEDVPVDTEYDKSDVEITVTYHDGSQTTLTGDAWQESGLLVTEVGKNKFTATYEKFTDDYIVKGINPLIGIDAVYEGDDILVGKKYDKSDVKVTAIYQDGTEKELDKDEWEASGLKVKKTGKNKFTATYEGYKCKYTVKGYDDASVVHTGVEHSVMLIVVFMLIFVGSATVFIKTRKR